MAKRYIGDAVVGTTDDEPRFTSSYSQYGGTARGGDVMDYIVHRGTNY